SAIRWLSATVGSARRCASRGQLGLFGTSIAATWLAADLKDAVGFFVDEDPARVGKTFMERPIYHPSRVPPDSHIFLGLARPLADTVYRRLTRPGVSYHLPPELPG